MWRARPVVRFGLAVLVFCAALGLGRPAQANVVCIEVGDCTTCAFTDGDGKPAGYAHWCRPAN